MERLNCKSTDNINQWLYLTEVINNTYYFNVKTQSWIARDNKPSNESFYTHTAYVLDIDLYVAV